MTNIKEKKIVFIFQMRQLCLEVCSQFELPLVTVPDDLQEFQQVGVFQICLAAELVTADVQTYREKLVYLRKLDRELVRHQLYEPANMYDKVSQAAISKKEI